jgi:hypothetical protein
MTSACSEKEKLKAVMNSYIGYNIESVSSKLGHPLSTTEEGAYKIYKYGFSNISFVKNRTSNNSSSTAGGFWSGVADGLSYNGGYYQQYNCSLEFKVDQQSIIRNYYYTGNSCSAYGKKKYVNPRYILDLPNKVTEFYGFEYKKTKKGLKVESIDERSRAFEAGLNNGDIIQKINGQSIIALPIEFAADLISKNRKIKLDILRKKEMKILTIEITKIPTLEFYQKGIRKFLGFS